MPNQRDPKKKILGGFVVEEEREAAQALARLLGVTVTELIRGYIREQCRARRPLPEHHTRTGEETRWNPIA